MKKVVNYNIRFLRNIAIFLVVLTHVSAWQMFFGGNKSGYFVFNALSQIGCPLFFMIGGALLLSRKDSILGFLYFQ